MYSESSHNNEVVEVMVVGQEIRSNEYFYNVKFEEELFFVKCFSWQLLEKYETPVKILCYKNSYGTGKNELIQVGGQHLVHPYYKNGYEYPFLIDDIEITQPSTNEVMLILSGKDNIQSSIYHRLSRFDDLEKGQEILCKYLGISKTGELHIIPKRKFIPIEEVLDDIKLAKSTFYNLENYCDPNIKKLFLEYEKKENIWILTYCNFLQKKIISLLENMAFSDVDLYVKSILLTEKWIIHSGFLTTFSTENRKQAKIKAEFTIEKFTYIQEFIYLVTKMQYHDFLNKIIKSKEHLTSLQLEIIYLLLRYCSNTMIDNYTFTETIRRIGKEEYFSDDLKFKYIRVISNRKKELRKKIYLNAESNLDVNIDFLYDKSLLKSLIPLTFYESIILKELNRKNEFKHTRTSFIKQCAYLVDDSSLKKELFRTAIVVSNKECEDIDNLLFNWNMPAFNSKTVEMVLSSYSIFCKEENAIKEIVSARKNTNKLPCTIIGKYENGFQIEYKGIIGILLFKEIENSFKYKICDNINVYVLEYESFSKEFLATTIFAAINFYSNTINQFNWNKFWDYNGLKSHIADLRRKQLDEINIGDTFHGTVKNITEYGAFITIGFVDALLHKNEVKWGYISNVSDELKLFQQVQVIVIAKNDSQLNVSIKQLEEDPWDNIEKISIGDILIASICKRTSRGYIIELENKLLAFLNEQYIHDLKSLHVNSNNKYSVRIKQVDKNNRRIYVDNPKSYEKEDFEDFDNSIENLEEIVHYEDDQSLRNISFEKAFIIENYALTIPDIDHKLALLEWVKLYTYIYPTRKSYLVELYIKFYRILRLFYKNEHISNLHKYFSQIEYEEVFSKTLIAFPHVKKILEIIEILVLFGNTENRTISQLTDIIVGSETDSLMSNLSKLVLSANLMYSIMREDRYLRGRQKQIYKFLEDGFINFYFNYDVSDKEILEEQKLFAMISEGETDLIEFKSTLLYDVKERKVNRVLEREVLKTLVAFLNTKGGTLFIGIEDNGEVYGLENDFCNVPGSSKEPKDKFLLYLDSLINNSIGKEFNTFMEVRFKKLHKKEICIITVTQAKSPAFLSYKKNNEEYYIRNKAQSCKLSMSEMAKYLEERITS